MSEKHQCEGRVRYGDFGRSRPCTRAGAYEHEGHHYCKLHHPPSIKAKQVARREQWEKEWANNAATAAKAKAEAIEQKRRADCYPDLLAALFNMLEDGDKTDREQALTAIYKATGMQP